MVAVTTRSFDASRSGANIHETILTPDAVRRRGVKQALVLQTPDDPRLEAQPLYVGGLEIGGRAHDVVFQATMGNNIYAWDANTGAQLWKTHLGRPIDGASAFKGQKDSDIDAHRINKAWGILSTPVIDLARGQMYVCFWSAGDGNWRNGRHLVAAVDIRTGAQSKNALDLEATTFSPGQGLAGITFKSLERKQRSALSLVGGAVIIPFGTIAESDDNARGWLIAVDVDKWEVSAAWCSTSLGSGGGIWMSGAGPAIQRDGSIWVVTGNGDFDGVHDFGESVVRLRYDPPTAGAAGRFHVTGWWTPWTDSGRQRGNPGGEDVKKMIPHPTPSNFRVGPHLAALGLHKIDDTWSDQDLGACGIVLVEDKGVALVSGKDGILYTIRLDHPGNTTQAALAPDHVAGNYAKLASAPILYTYFDPGIDPAPRNPADLNRFAGNKTHHLHGTPLAWKSAANGMLHFCGGENGNLRAWKLRDDHSSQYLACSEAWASAAATSQFGGMPGWSINLSANGGAGGVVWALIPYGDSNDSLTNGRLLAYDAENFGRFGDGSGEIQPLWDSQQWNWNLLHPKFNRPIVADGKVFVPTYDGKLLVLTLA